MSRSSGRSGPAPLRCPPSVRQHPLCATASPVRGGGGGSRGGARASPATQPPPLPPGHRSRRDRAVQRRPRCCPLGHCLPSRWSRRTASARTPWPRRTLDPSFTTSAQLLTAGKRASGIPSGPGQAESGSVLLPPVPETQQSWTSLTCLQVLKIPFIPSGRRVRGRES